MSQTSDTTAGSGGNFDPQQAAALLDQSTQRARRQFMPGPPLLWTYRAVMVLVAFGAFWLSVRGQQPYTGPTAPAIAVMAALVAINIGWSAWTVKRAASGVSGPAQRAWRMWAGITLVVLVASFAVIAPAYQAGASQPIWGLYLANGPLLITGIVGVVASAALRVRTIAGPMLGIAAVAVIAGFGGPAGAWLIMGIGLCVVCLGTAAFKARQQRRSLVRS
jgi:hypothetical protein